MSPAFASTIEGVRITHLTRADPHPLDVHVEGIKRLSDEAFRVVYETLADDLVSFAYGMVSDRRTAEDIVQQSFMELVKAAPRMRGGGRSLKAWLFKSVRYGCLDEYRRRSRRPEIPHPVIPDSPEADDPLAEHLTPELEAALASLSKRHRTVLILRHVSGLSGEEIARVIGSSRRATYAVLARAEDKLRKSLDGEK